MDTVSKIYFYHCEEEKTKINWFLYEYVNLLHGEIIKNDQLEVFRKELKTNQRLIEFCIYLANRIVASVENKAIGKEHLITISSEDIEWLYPKTPRSCTSILMKMASSTWHEHWRNCKDCSMQCLRDQESYTSMFDKIDEKGFYK